MARIAEQLRQGLIDEPESYHGVYEDVIYAVTVGKAEDGRKLVDGMISAIHQEGEFGEGENLGSSNVIVWYGPNGAEAMNVTLRDLDALRDYNKTGVVDPERPFTSFETFYIPFNSEAVSGGGVYLDEGKLIYERVFDSSVGAQLARAEFPFILGQDFADILNGESRLVADNDKELFDEVENGVKIGIPLSRDVFPAKYMASFTSSSLVSST